MQKIELNLYGKTSEEAAQIRVLFAMFLATLSTAELLRVKEKLHKNPNLIKSALKWI